jgi:N-dimethylarginine dimethylaminohydrolase
MKKILMCDPQFFGVTYDINPWMSANIGQVDQKIATHQWTLLRDAISAVAEVEVMPGVEGLPDLVFTANAGIVRNNHAIVAKFSKPERSREEVHFEKWFSEHKLITVQPMNSYEGEGDHLVDRLGRHWLGTGFRTDTKVAEELTRILWVRMNLLELVDPRWYHLDTCFAPLPYGEVIWYPGAFSEDSQHLIRSAFRTRIEVTQEDASAFACNLVALGNNIFIPKNTVASERLQGLGYKVKEFDLSEFMRAGGAAKCLTLYC